MFENLNRNENVLIVRSIVIDYDLCDVVQKYDYIKKK